MDGNVDLGAKLEQAVADLVDSGRYRSRDELLREGARLIHEREARLAAIHAKIEQGIADADAGRLTPIEDVIAEFKERYRSGPPKG
jgi:antitoxin ParD1/3/4